MIGGITNTTWMSNRTHFFNSDTNEWKRGPDLLNGRIYHASGELIDHVTGNQHVAVVGGAGIETKGARQNLNFEVKNSSFPCCNSL